MSNRGHPGCRPEPVSLLESASVPPTDSTLCAPLRRPDSRQNLRLQIFLVADVVKAVVTLLWPRALCGFTPT